MRTEPPCRGPETTGLPQQGHVTGAELPQAQTGEPQPGPGVQAMPWIGPQEPCCCSGEARLPSLGQWRALP